jgi:GxxExxY protein
MHNQLSGIIVDAAYQVHSRLGPGMLESVYEKVLAHELAKRGLKVLSQVPIAIVYDDLLIEDAFKTDLIINDCLILELKSVEKLLPIHSKQLLTYLKLTDYKLGLLLNFGAPLIKDGIIRLVNGLPEG